MSEAPLSPDEIRQRLSTGWSLDTTMPGFAAVARDLFRPLVKPMAGREIIYTCRRSWLLRITSLKVHGHGFSAIGELADRVPGDYFDWTLNEPFDFAARWRYLTMKGARISMLMLTDCFYPDPAVVAEVKAAAVRGADPREIGGILARAAGDESSIDAQR
jgi:hypothetical protein